MKRLILVASSILAMSSLSHAQYKGKYEGWSSGYIFTGTLSQVVWKSYTHLFNFQVTVTSAGALGTGNLAIGHSEFVAACKTNGLKSILCIGGQGQSKNFSAACANPATQTKLVNNILAMVKSGGYDGVDMDWESGEENDGAAMTAKFKAFHKELRDSINKITPRPLMMAAMSSDWYPNCSAAIAEYVDQLNNMSYYNRVTDMDKIFKPVVDQGVKKSLMGVGFGFDTDNEITDINDIIAKCKYAIDNGYGGIMVWDITHAPKATSDSIAHYVTHSPTTALAPSSRANGSIANLSILNNRVTGRNEIAFTVPSTVNAAFVDLGVYSLDGARVRTLVQGFRRAGAYQVDMNQGEEAGSSLKPGNYVVRLNTNRKSETASVVIAR